MFNNFVEKGHTILEDSDNVVLVIHGGAGTMTRAGSTHAQRKAFRLALAESLRAGSIHERITRGCSLLTCRV
jgi:beta-aspartyl-peptidase (threonine type)